MALVTAVDHREQVIRIPGPRPLRVALRRLRRACRAHPMQQGSAKRRSAERHVRFYAWITASGAPTKPAS
jgi:chromosome condensin MukBEF MukE localization factor